MDWQLTCRVCLETGDMVSLFDWDENNEQLGDKYTYCCGVEVTKNDSLPTLICLNCVDRLTFAYQFKQQCLSSNETLKECLEEFERSANSVSAPTTSKTTETETITIKQENGLLLQYELPVEHDPAALWSLNDKSPLSAVVTKAPGPRKRGRPRKYPNEQGQIDVSPYNRKKPKAAQKEEESLTTLLASGSLELNDLKVEPDQTEDDADAFGGDFLDDDDPDFNPQESEPEEKKTPKKRGRPRKNDPKKELASEDGEDVLLKETIMAFSEPIPDHILNPKPKKRYPKKRYNYEKTHTCETCGASFTSNASLQAHIRRHLGIKPFVCSICGYSCVISNELRRHMLKHTGQKPYKCRLCERRFADFGTRQKHERLHMGLRPYQCKLCSKSFTYSYVLSNHMLTHTGEKKYSCGPCNKKFTKAHHLKYHNKVHHKDLYLQQQAAEECKKRAAQAVRMTGVLAGEVVDGTLQLIHAAEDDGEHDAQMQVVEEQDDADDADRETHRAVADMQACYHTSHSLYDSEIKRSRLKKPLTPAERMRQYRERLKLNPDKLEAQRIKNLERIKSKYVYKKVEEMSAGEKLRQRKKWREQKRKKEMMIVLV